MTEGYAPVLFFLETQEISTQCSYNQPYIIWKNNHIAVSVPLLMNSILYPLMGYYIVHRSEELFYQKKVLILTNIVGLCALITNTVVAFMAHRQRGAGETLGGMTVVLAVVTFINIHALFNWISKSSCKFLHGHLAGLVKKGIIFIGSDALRVPNLFYTYMSSVP